MSMVTPEAGEDAGEMLQLPPCMMIYCFSVVEKTSM